jgi:tRNA-Thr(GGU) m(6)t(6)A37 methyltransferase TsaA
VYTSSLLQEARRKLEKEKVSRAADRQGRISAEKQLRSRAQAQQAADGYCFSAIGFVRSCFKDRRGTPRQPVLAPDTRCRIHFTNAVQPAALEQLERFSHVWVIFVFHQNTNLGNKKAVPSKIAPPRLAGKKVGCLSTRTPHRPNPVGLSVVKLRAVHQHSVELSGIDFVDGTPILDIKPFIPYDNVDPTALQVPEWVLPESTPPMLVNLTESAETGLKLAVESGLEFYDKVHDAKLALKQVLAQDIRSLHQKNMIEGSTQGKTKDGAPRIYELYFDRMHVHYTALDGKVSIEEIQLLSC